MAANKGNTFDPFNDRRARLVRNRLSTAFIEAVQRKDFSLVEERAGQLASEYQGSLYRRYISEKIDHYREVFFDCVAGLAGSCDIFDLAVQLWKHRLFFEVHELLEGEWGRASGKRRKALQGLIQAAGYYLLLAAGNESGAGKLANKAIANIAANRDLLPKKLRLDRLLADLKGRSAEASPLA